MPKGQLQRRKPLDKRAAGESKEALRQKGQEFFEDKGVAALAKGNND